MQSTRTPRRSRRSVEVAAVSITLLGLIFVGIAARLAVAQPNLFVTLQKLGLQKLDGQIPAYYSDGSQERAQKVCSQVRAMAGFYEAELGINAPVVVAVLNSDDWAKVRLGPYGLPSVGGTPPVVFMPATSGGFAYHLMVARKDAIPANLLQEYLEDHHTTFDAAANEFVDLIGLHELGHALIDAYGIDDNCHWLDEYLASYFAYAYIAEHRPDLREVFDLLGRPSKVRPENTTLADLERLYSRVDDYGWYQGMFESHIQQLYPKMKLQFITELRERFPADGAGRTKSNSLSPEQVLSELEEFAPGFENWAKGFHD